MIFPLVHIMTVVEVASAALANTQQKKVMTWIHVKDEVPRPSDGHILVYGTLPNGGLSAVVVHYDYGAWIDVVDGCDVDFQWWCRITKPECLQ